MDMDIIFVMIVIANWKLHLEQKQLHYTDNKTSVLRKHLHRQMLTQS